MNTYDYMYDVLKLRGKIFITIEQMMKLKDEDVPFKFGYVCGNWGHTCNERNDLILHCKETSELEKEISCRINLNKGDINAKQVMYITNIWKWKYLVEEHSRDYKDGGIHLINLSIYYKEEEEYDN